MPSRSKNQKMNSTKTIIRSDRNRFSDLNINSSGGDYKPSDGPSREKLLRLAASRLSLSSPSQGAARILRVELPKHNGASELPREYSQHLYLRTSGS